MRRSAVRLLVVAMLSSPLHADVCWLPLSDEEALRAAYAVFSGTVVEIVEARNVPFVPRLQVDPLWARIRSEVPPLHSSFLVHFRVAKTFKGPVGDVARIRTSTVENCGIRFVAGETYLVYAAGEGLEVSSLMPTRQLANTTLTPTATSSPQS